MRALLGWLLGIVVRCWAATWRVRIVVEPGAEAGPRVLAFWHGRQMPLLRARGARPTVAMVSLSKDGELSARVMQSLGLEVVRGSSSRGGARALRAVVAALRAGFDAVFAVDGPRGPFGLPKPGAAQAARLGRAAMVPVGSAASHALVLTRAWDRFLLPWPFSRVAIVAGAPIDAERALAEPELVAAAISRAEAEARALVSDWRRAA